MTSKRVVAILYSLHSWAGILVGLWVFVVCVTGSVLVFKNEIDLWANPSLNGLPRASPPAGPDNVLQNLKRLHPEATPTFLGLPTAASPSWSILTNGIDGRERNRFAARADTGEVVGLVDSELGQFIRNLHVFLLFGPRWPVGFLGVVVLFLLASGLVIHRKVIKDLFTLRWGRSLRVVTADLHRALGVWGLGFYLVLAFTGAWLGLAPVFERGIAYIAGPSAAPPAPSPVPSASSERGHVSLDALLERARRDIPNFEVTALGLTKWGHPDAIVRVTGRLRGSLGGDVNVTYAAATGATLGPSPATIGGFWSSFARLMEPLHFGDFGGIVLKWLYFILGLMQAGLTLTGTLIWFERSKLKARPVPVARSESTRTSRVPSML
jgi:uncharacterized iron-regulated membrane protein